MHPLLRQAIILDTETTGLHRGAGIHEVALYDLESRSVREYLLDPNMIVSSSGVENDELKLVSGPMDVHEKVRGLRSWLDVLKKEGQVRGDATRRKDVLESLKRSNRFMYNQIVSGRAPHLLGDKETTEAMEARRQVLKARGVHKADLGRRITMDQFLGGELQRNMKAGRTIWIANAVFEAKQFGAQIAAREAEIADSIKSGLETYNPSSPDPFYVTGKEVNAARTQAQVTGDWTGVWKAYKAHPAKAGQTAVRDILDVTKSFMSYGKQLGLYGGAARFGTSIDVSKRLLQTSLGQLAAEESHRAAEDVVDEAFVLKHMSALTENLQRLAETGGADQDLLRVAGNYFQNLEASGPALERQAVIQRLARAQRDIAAEGKSVQYVGPARVYSQQQLDPQGNIVEMKRQLPKRRSMSSMDEVQQYLRRSGDYSRYGTDIAAEAKSIRGLGAEALDAYEYRARAGTQLVLNKIGTGRLDDVLARGSNKGVKSALGLASSALRGRGSAALGLAAAVGVAGALGSAAGAHPRGQPASILSYNYDDWVQRQDGMQHRGVGGANRSKLTDFGSPYQGSGVSAQVFVDQELLQEREKWMRSQYGAAHFDPVNGPFGLNGVFKFRQGGYSYLQAGSPIASGTYSGLRGDNLMALNMGDGGWKMTVEDADTVVVKRGGIRGAVSSFFGMNRGYSFRLAGIDSTETSHGSTSYHAPQPGAENAATALRSMISGSKDVRLVFDPTQTTYGRMMGAVIADGKNVNFEAVKRGWAAHLPFGNPADSMIDYRALKSSEERAYGAGRGMWGTPWARTFYEASEAAGERVTFNTLTKKSKLVQNANTMNMLSLMEENQRRGQFGAAQAAQARDLGQGAKFIGSDSVGPIMFDRPAAPHNSYMHAQQRDLAQFTRTKGTGYNRDRLRRRGGYGSLDGSMALDSMGTTNTVWTKTKLQAFERYNASTQARSERRQRMAEHQRSANQMVFSSAIGHHRM